MSDFAYVGDPNDLSSWHLPCDKDHIEAATRLIAHTKSVPKSARKKVLDFVRRAAKKFGVEIPDEPTDAQKKWVGEAIEPTSPPRTKAYDTQRENPPAPRKAGLTFRQYLWSPDASDPSTWAMPVSTPAEIEAAFSELPKHSEIPLTVRAALVARLLLVARSAGVNVDVSPELLSYSGIVLPAASMRPPDGVPSQYPSWSKDGSAIEQMRSAVGLPRLHETQIDVGRLSGSQRRMRELSNLEHVPETHLRLSEEQQTLRRLAGISEDSQPRDERGRFGGHRDGKSPEQHAAEHARTPREHKQAAEYHRRKALAHQNAGRGEIAAAHLKAADLHDRAAREDENISSARAQVGSADCHAAEKQFNDGAAQKFADNMSGLGLDVPAPSGEGSDSRGRLLLTEQLAGGFAVSDDLGTSAVDESAGMPVRAVCHVADKPTANGRVYSRKILQREIGKLNKRIANGEDVVGTTNHPPDGQPNIRDAAVRWHHFQMHPDGTVTGDGTVLHTAAGKDVQKMLHAGLKPGVSARGFGTTSRANDCDEVNSDYELESFDVLLNQAVPEARLHKVKQPDPSVMEPADSDVAADDIGSSFASGVGG
jgi:hypothetical protein